VHKTDSEQNWDGEENIYGEKEIVVNCYNESGTEEEKNEMFGLECSTVCSRDVDVDADRRLESLWNVDMENNMEKISWLDRVTNEISGE